MGPFQTKFIDRLMQPQNMQVNSKKKPFTFNFFFVLTFQLISEIRSLSADCLPSLLGASACGVSASQLFGRSVANFFNPMRVLSI